MLTVKCCFVFDKTRRLVNGKVLKEMSSSKHRKEKKDPQKIDAYDLQMDPDLCDGYKFHKAYETIRVTFTFHNLEMVFTVTVIYLMILDMLYDYYDRYKALLMSKGRRWVEICSEILHCYGLYSVHEGV